MASDLGGIVGTSFLPLLILSIDQVAAARDTFARAKKLEGFSVITDNEGSIYLAMGNHPDGRSVIFAIGPYHSPRIIEHQRQPEPPLDYRGCAS